MPTVAEQYVSPALVDQAIAQLRTGKFDRFLGPKYMGRLQRAGLARNGSVNWTAAAGIIKRTDQAARLLSLARTWFSRIQRWFNHA